MVESLDADLSEPVAGNVRHVRLKPTHIPRSMKTIQTVGQIETVRIDSDAGPQALTEVIHIAGATAGVDGGKKVVVTDLRTS